MRRKIVAMADHHGFDRYAQFVDAHALAMRRNARTQMPLNSIAGDFSDAYTKEKIRRKS
jgi:hypothetical protein